MKNKTSKIFVEDIIIAIDKINRFVSSKTYTTFIEDEMALDAVLRNIEIIGEVSKNIPDDVRKKFPDIPWKRMIGLRNIVSHEYFGIDLSIIWQIVKKDLPEIVPAIKTMLLDDEI